MVDRGFTLVEVLVALAVLAIAMAAALRAVSASTDTAADLATRTLAGWVAQNRLAEIAARGEFPEPGRREGQSSMAGRDFVWQEEDGISPNRSFRRVEIRVYAAGDTTHAFATLVGYLARTPR
ncbi:type II secretion system minor pseudopilin GspI [Jeongeupia naejangsanensis]|uniref:Type II secretion system protein I n=1 Tax=Jeongeupia naejangsanensis TaxID=613195 RepID=A0ABS2BGT2_9NEIS|nr:type II secretion system minor pseudopilin GspI [Jeongeupia naejangsanensis]MBM3114813.1 type II secretion system minor pseudopilin GspI [Jeongeupia naejangsanensis]